MSHSKYPLHVQSVRGICYAILASNHAIIVSNSSLARLRWSCRTPCAPSNDFSTSVARASNLATSFSYCSLFVRTPIHPIRQGRRALCYAPCRHPQDEECNKHCGPCPQHHEGCEDHNNKTDQGNATAHHTHILSCIISPTYQGRL